MAAAIIALPGLAADSAGIGRYRRRFLGWALQLLERLAPPHYGKANSDLQPEFIKYPPV